MVISAKDTAREKSLGFYIQLEESFIGQSFYSCSSDDPYRTTVILYLCRNGGTGLETQFLNAITALQAGKRWPIRLNWSNAKKFFSVGALRQLEACFTGVTFYLYDAAELDIRKIDSSKLYYAMRYQKRKRKMEATNA